MARSGATRNKKGAAGSSQPLWLVFTAGLVVGVALTWLMQSVILQGKGGDKIVEAVKEVATPKVNEDELTLPRFEFYSILPELEVVIPEPLTESLRDVLPGDAEPAEKPEESTTAESTPAPTNSTETYYIQAGSFRKPEDAERMKVKLLLMGLDVEVKAVEVEGKQYHRVRIGPITNFSAFETARNRLKENNVQYIVLKSRNQ
ncbi:MAG: SPOR domain-containing protein [Pseudomonadota bacterium]